MGPSSSNSAESPLRYSCARNSLGTHRALGLSPRHHALLPHQARSCRLKRGRSLMLLSHARLSPTQASRSSVLLSHTRRYRSLDSAHSTMLLPVAADVVTACAYATTLPLTTRCCFLRLHHTLWGSRRRSGHSLSPFPTKTPDQTQRSPAPCGTWPYQKKRRCACPTREPRRCPRSAATSPAQGQTPRRAS